MFHSTSRSRLPAACFPYGVNPGCRKQNAYLTKRAERQLSLSTNAFATFSSAPMFKLCGTLLLRKTFRHL